MKLSVILTFICFTAVAQQKPKSYPLPPRVNYYLTDKDTLRHVVFKYNTKRDSYIFGKDVKATSLSASEITKAERLIAKRAATYNEHSKSSYDRIEQALKYYMQFIAVVNGRGEKIVWVNCSCEVIGNIWKTDFGVVSDGGACYFRIKINLTKGTVIYFGVNGVA